ncbi:UNKNOWN [Stylonychia lemnae]|uniref:Uncharacterized protein n=1 Tax=Stylonychia lemnae TaxID=5949 RepID=A0A078BEU2_STYLE|nr:UNKNOWN [Stylonychia lemnae]|eukprot:CDW91682.1 UNKNOWN [Stylonychia lemnae]
MSNTHQAQNDKDKKQPNAFEDFFDCSEIDNQDYSQFINDQSQFIVGQNGEHIKATETNQDEQQDINIDVNNIVSLIRLEDQELEQQKAQDQEQAIQQNDEDIGDISPIAEVRVAIKEQMNHQRDYVDRATSII